MRSALFPLSLFFGRQLGRRDRLEPCIGNRHPALDRESVGSGREASLGALDSAQLPAQILGSGFVELVLIEIGGEVRWIDLVGRLAVVLMPEARERALEALTL